MTTPTGTLKSALFRATSDGWVFRSPNPWVFGDTPHYLVNDAQKARIEAIVTPKPVVVGVLVAGGIIAWTVLVVTFLWAITGHQEPTPADIVLMVILILVPALCILPIVGLIQRHRLAPVLEGVPLTNERISNAELQKNVRAATPIKHSLNALVASLFAFFAALFAVLTHMASRHFAIDSHVALWSFVALAFGFASVVWYRQVLSKAAALEASEDC
jgi:hypothetical protein